MPNFLVAMCRGCLKHDVPLFETMEGDKSNFNKNRNSIVIQELFRKEFMEEFNNWKLCEDCTILLKGAVFLERGLLSSQKIYTNYLRTLKSNSYAKSNKFLNLTIEIEDVRLTGLTPEEKDVNKVQYGTVEVETAFKNDLEDGCEKQVHVENLECDVIEIDDIKIEIDEPYDKEMLDGCHSVERTTETELSIERTTNIKLNAENETVEKFHELNLGAHNVEQLSDMEQEEDKALLQLDVKIKIDTDENCADEEESATDSFKCSICQRKLLNKQTLQQHLKAHGDVQIYECDVCHKQFKTKNNWMVHYRMHTNERPFKCKLCKNAYTNKRALNLHMLKHTGERPFECDICKKTFSRKVHLATHKQFHLGVKFSCPTCDRIFTQKGHLSVHMNNEGHSQTGTKYECKICSINFFTLAHFREHRTVHTGEPSSYTCDICGSICSTKAILHRHKKKHTSNVAKQHKCEQCAKAFQTKYDLKLHGRIHTGEKPYKCRLCAKEFAYRSNYAVHSRKVHSVEINNEECAVVAKVEPLCDDD